MKPVAGDFDYPLDPARIAQRPLERRDESRLMVLNRETAVTKLRIFTELPSLLRSGDVLVINNTRVIPARFFCRRATGGRIEGLFLRQDGQGDEPGQWRVLLKGAGRCRGGERLELLGSDEAVEVELLESLGRGEWRVAAHPPAPAGEILARAGRTPLPPYIRRPGGADMPADDADQHRYQTVYASSDGAVAAPTAGLHFTPEIIAALAGRDIHPLTVTLHVGLGTFAPVKVESLAEHRMHSEWYEMTADTAAALNAARDERRRIVAVGTTSVRVLESVVGPDDRFEARSGWTDIFLYPPAKFRATDALITNFHLPRSTLLMLVSAFCCPGRTDGVEMIRAAYARAAAEQFRFFSYGDAMLIE